MTASPEIWKPIRGHSPYEVSSTGRVRNGKKTLAPRLYGVGYYGVRLHGVEHYVHRLVAAAHINPIPESFQVNHLNKDRLNNHVNNLEICTPKENCTHAKHPMWYNSQYKLFKYVTV